MKKKKCGKGGLTDIDWKPVVMYTPFSSITGNQVLQGLIMDINFQQLTSMRVLITNFHMKEIYTSEIFYSFYFVKIM